VHVHAPEEPPVLCVGGEHDQEARHRVVTRSGRVAPVGMIPRRSSSTIIVGEVVYDTQASPVRLEAITWTTDCVSGRRAVKVPPSTVWIDTFDLLEEAVIRPHGA
jgi:hypothetical protein